MTTPFLVAVAPNGARKQKADHANVPLTGAESAKVAAACFEAGAGMLHLHVRDDDGGHLLDADAYIEATKAVRKEVGPDMVIQITTEAVGKYSAAEQMAVVRATKPEAVSMAVKELVPDSESESTAAAFFAELNRDQVLAQYILYSPEDWHRYKDLVARGIIPDDTHSVLFVLGRYSKILTSQPSELIPFIQQDGVNTAAWMVCAFGSGEGPTAATAASLGGHMRVGMENNLWLADGTKIEHNHDLVSQAAAAAKLCARPLARSQAARDVLAGRIRSETDYA
jgi:uncharacterized protein (DUF849 family)